MTRPNTVLVFWLVQGKRRNLSRCVLEGIGTAIAFAIVASVTCCAGLWELLQGKRGDQIQPTPEDAKQETEMVLSDVVENLLQKTKTSPLEVRAPRHACHPRLCRQLVRLQPNDTGLLTLAVNL